MRRALVNRLALSISVLGGTWLVILAAAPPAGALFGCGLNPACMFGKGVSGAVSSVASDAITALAKAVLGATREGDRVDVDALGEHPDTHPR